MFHPLYFIYSCSMKRAIESLTLIFSPTKRLRSAEKVLDPPESAKPVSPDVDSLLDTLERLQSQLLDFDKCCCEEQMIVQKKYDAKKKPVLENRKKIISEIPGFWGIAIRNHPVGKGLPHVEADILKYLSDIQVEDNQDANGSYEIIFTFLQNPYFSETCLSRSVVFSSGGESGDPPEDLVSSTKINWAPGKCPLQNGYDSRKISKSEFSFFLWFSSGAPVASDDFGETLRRDLWQNPYPYYLSLSEDFN